MKDERNPAVRRYRTSQRRGVPSENRRGGSRQSLSLWGSFDWRMAVGVVFIVAAAIGVVLAMAPASQDNVQTIATPPATFGINLASFRQGFDRTAAAVAPVGSDAIVSCDTMPDGSQECATSDVGFQRLVTLMRASGLTDRALRQKVLVVARPAADGRLASIEVDGTRADRANQLRFSDVVADVAGALSGASVGSSASLSDLRIRLMSGDSDRSINEPIFATTPHANIECLRARSGVSLAMRCIFHPL